MGAEEFLQKVRLVKQKKPYLLQPELLATLFPSSICQLELLKCVIYQELMAAYDEHDTDENCVSIMVKPGQGLKLIANKQFKKNELMLLPLTDHVSSILFEEPKVKGWGWASRADAPHIYIMPPKLGKEIEKGTIVPFFLVTVAKCHIAMWTLAK